MALVITSPVATKADTTDGTSYATASFTPTANSLLLVFANAQASIAPGSLISVVGFNLINRQQNGGDSWWAWWAQVGAAPEAMTLTLDLTGDAATGGFIKTFQITGHKALAPIAQSIFSTVKTTGANPALTFPGARNTNNAYVCAFVNNTNPFSSTPPASWTEADDTGFGTPATGLTTAFRVGGETATLVTFTAVSSIWIGMGIEIALDTAGVVSQKLSALGVG